MPAKQDALAKSVRWPVTISYFNASIGRPRPRPIRSRSSFTRTGSAARLKLDYGDFALKGDLQKLEVHPYTSLSALRLPQREAALQRDAAELVRGSGRWPAPLRPGGPPPGPPRSPRSASAPSHRSAAPIPISRNAVPSQARWQHLARRLEQANRQLGRRQAGAGSGRSRNSRVLQLQNDALSGKAAAFSRRETFSDEPPENGLEILEGAQVGVESGLGRDALGLMFDDDVSAVLAPRQCGAGACDPVRAPRRELRRALRAGAGSGSRPPSASRACAAAPMPGMIDTGLSARNVRASALPDDREPARLLEVRGDLGEKLVVGQARSRR